MAFRIVEMQKKTTELGFPGSHGNVKEAAKRHDQPNPKGTWNLEPCKMQQETTTLFFLESHGS